MRLLCLDLIAATPLAVVLVWWKLDFLLREIPGMGQLPIHPQRLGPGTRALGCVAPGERALSIALNSNDIVTMFIGGVFITVARVMAEGHRLAEDNAGIV